MTTYTPRQLQTITDFMQQVNDHWNSLTDEQRAAAEQRSARLVAEVEAILRTRRGEILDYRCDVAQRLLNRDGAYDPDTLPLGAELAEVTAALDVLTA